MDVLIAIGGVSICLLIKGRFLGGTLSAFYFWERGQWNKYNGKQLLLLFLFLASHWATLRVSLLCALPIVTCQPQTSFDCLWAIPSNVQGLLGALYSGITPGDTSVEPRSAVWEVSALTFFGLSWRKLLDSKRYFIKLGGDGDSKVGTETKPKHNYRTLIHPRDEGIIMSKQSIVLREICTRSASPSLCKKDIKELLRWKERWVLY